MIQGMNTKLWDHSMEAHIFPHVNCHTAQFFSQNVQFFQFIGCQSGGTRLVRCDFGGGKVSWLVGAIGSLILGAVWGQVLLLQGDW